MKNKKKNIVDVDFNFASKQNKLTLSELEKIIYTLINLRLYFIIKLIFLVKEWKNAKD